MPGPYINQSPEVNASGLFVWPGKEKRRFFTAAIPGSKLATDFDPGSGAGFEDTGIKIDMNKATETIWRLPKEMTDSSPVTPAKAGVQTCRAERRDRRAWIPAPAFAGASLSQ